MQRGNFFTGNNEETFDKPFGSEDCLYLNLWVPSERHHNKRPVLVFFHGGSGISGAASHPLYDGARLARESGAVVITANYRLGVFGSLQSPALHSNNAAENSGSFYLLDMIRVLDWTRENCPAFNCDGNNITLSGQSAGAVAVLALLRSPLAKGKFSRAISFSGIPLSASMEAATKRTHKLLAELMLNDETATSDRGAERELSSINNTTLRDYLYRKSALELLQASGTGLSPLAVADGTVLMALDNADEPSTESVSNVPLMIGKTRNEMTTLIPIKGIGRSAVLAWPLFNGEPRDDTINEQLGWFSAIKRNIRVSIGECYVARKFRQYVRQYSKKLPAVYVYNFEWENYPDPWRADLGSFHGLDMPFFFGNFINDESIYMRFAWTADNEVEREAIHNSMIKSIRSFIHSGNPNNAVGDQEKWLPWDEREYTKIWGGSISE